MCFAHSNVYCERVVWPWSVQRNKYVKDYSAAISSRRNRRGDTFRGRPHGGRLKARIAHQRFIFLTASVSASIIAHYPIQRNKIFILLRSRTQQIYRRTRYGEQSAQYPRRTLDATKYTFCWRWPVKPVCGRCPDRYQTATPFCCIIPRNAGAVKPCRAFSGIFAPKARRPWHK